MGDLMPPTVQAEMEVVTRYTSQTLDRKIVPRPGLQAHRLHQVGPLGTVVSGSGTVGQGRGQVSGLLGENFIDPLRYPGQQLWVQLDLEGSGPGPPGGGPQASVPNHLHVGESIEDSPGVEEAPGPGLEVRRLREVGRLRLAVGWRWLREHGGAVEIGVRGSQRGR